MFGTTLEYVFCSELNNQRSLLGHKAKGTFQFSHDGKGPLSLVPNLPLCRCGNHISGVLAYLIRPVAQQQGPFVFLMKK